MIVVKYHKDGKLYVVEASGHAGYADVGYDIVCSAVSAIFINTINLLERLDIDFKKKEDDKIPLMKIKVSDCTPLTNSILDNLVASIKDICREYPQNIKIWEEEQ